MSTVDGGGGGGGPAYSDSLFDQVLTEIEDLYGDLVGIETAAEAVRDFMLRNQVEGTNVGITVTRLNMPAGHAFTVYPMLTLENPEDPYQPWINACFKVGKDSAAGTGAWLKYLVDDFYLVETAALTSGASRQAVLSEAYLDGLEGSVGGAIDTVERNLAVNWQGGAQAGFFDWFNQAMDIETVLLLRYANGAQVAAGACGDAIAATQLVMLAQVEAARDSLKTVLQAWRDDSDQFPFPPGTGFKFKEIGAALTGELDKVKDLIPGPDWVGDLVVDKVTGKVLKKAGKKVPAVKAVTTTYSIFTTLEKNETDVSMQPSASEVMAATEKQLTAIAKEGQAVLDGLEGKVTALADALASASQLSVPRPNPNPGGHYTT